MTNSNFRSSQKIILFQFKRWRDDLISDHISKEDIQSYSTYSTVVSYLQYCSLLLFAPLRIQNRPISDTATLGIVRLGNTSCLHCHHILYLEWICSIPDTERCPFLRHRPISEWQHLVVRQGTPRATAVIIYLDWICSIPDTERCPFLRHRPISGTATLGSATCQHLMPLLSSYFLTEFAPPRKQSAALSCVTGQSLVRQHLVVRQANTSCHRCHHICSKVITGFNRVLPAKD